MALLQGIVDDARDPHELYTQTLDEQPSFLPLIPDPYFSEKQVQEDALLAPSSVAKHKA